MRERRLYLQWLATTALATPAGAQNVTSRPREVVWPSQPVNLIVPFPAGGTSAILARQLAQAFERTTRQSMRLQYQGGAAGLQGANLAAKAEANGQNLFIGGSHLALARTLVSNDEFDMLQDLRPLAMVAEVPQVLVVNPVRLRSRTVVELLADLSRKPMRYRIATAGVGSSSHLSAEILRHQESLRFDFVHFRGAGPALQDLLAGSVDMMLDALVSCLPHIRAGRLKPLMVTGSERVAVLPDVPCAQEIGLSGLDAVTWYGLFAPSQLPSAQSQLMQDVFARVAADPILQESFEGMGIRWGGLYGEKFAARVQQEAVQWAQRVKSLGLKQAWLKNMEES